MIDMNQFCAGKCAVCNTPVWSMGGNLMHAHNIPPDATDHEATFIRRAAPDAA